jgi:hypothetical protein
LSTGRVDRWELIGSGCGLENRASCADSRPQLPHRLKRSRVSSVPRIPNRSRRLGWTSDPSTNYPGSDVAAGHFAGSPCTTSVARPSRKVAASPNGPLGGPHESTMEVVHSFAETVLGWRILSVSLIVDGIDRSFEATRYAPTKQGHNPFVGTNTGLRSRPARRHPIRDSDTPTLGSEARPRSG